MDKIHQTYQLTIETLTPLHIGTGRLLQLGYDFVIHRNQTWVIDDNVLAQGLMEHSPDDFNRMIQGVKAQDLLRPEDYDENSPLFRYILKGTPRSSREGAHLQELIKNAYDQTYIPGSSLKGAIRTAIAFLGWLQQGLKFNPSMVGDKDRFAAQPLEAKVLRGKEDKPYYDIMRAVQVADTLPNPNVRLEVLNINAFTGGRSQAPIEIEGIPTGTIYQGSLTLDRYLLDTAADELGWTKLHRNLLKSLPIVINGFTDARIEKERERWRNQSEAKSIRGFYNYLKKELDGLTDNQFILQLGWGGGWDSKTFGEILQENPKNFAAVVKKFKEKMIRQGSFHEGDRFPKSRRLRIVNDQPVTPLGWIKITMEEI